MVNGGSQRVQLTVEQLREHQLGILKAVADHCDAHGLRYYLFAGTLLGAVRHRGYIPWDDDIDLMMPRPDFDALCETFPGKATPAGLSVRCLTRTEDYALPFAKVCDDTTSLEIESDLIHGVGINIDVFPLDGWLEGWQRRLQAGVLRLLLQIMRAKHMTMARKRSPLRTVVLAAVKGVTSVLPPRTVSGWIVRTATRADYDSSREAGALVWGTLEEFPVAAIGTPTPLEFEGSPYAAPEDPDTILRIHYGDYMRLPPADQQVTHHRFVAYEL